MKPIYVDREVRLVGVWAEEIKRQPGEAGELEEHMSSRKLEMWAEQEGRVGMTANASVD